MTDNVVGEPAKLTMWICCHCQGERMVGEANCPYCHKRMHDSVEYVRAVPSPSVAQPNADVEAFWTALERGWDIEPRSFFEAEAPKNGFGSPLAMAVHYMWKRETKADAAPSVAIEDERSVWDYCHALDCPLKGAQHLRTVGDCIENVGTDARKLAQRIRHRMMQGYIVWSEDELAKVLDIALSAYREIDHKEGIEDKADAIAVAFIQNHTKIPLDGEVHRSLVAAFTTALSAQHEAGYRKGIEDAAEIANAGVAGNRQSGIEVASRIAQAIRSKLKE